MIFTRPLIKIIYLLKICIKEYEIDTDINVNRVRLREEFRYSFINIAFVILNWETSYAWRLYDAL